MVRLLHCDCADKRWVVPPSKFQHLLQEAMAHHRGGRLARADAIYRQLSTLAPRNAVVWDLMAQVALQQGRSGDGMRHLINACRCDDHAVTSAVQLAGLLLDRQRGTEAEKILRHTTARNPQSHEAWNALGFALKMSGRPAEAVTCHERAVALSPKFAQGWYYLGLALGACGKNQRALECHERALAIDARYHPARQGRAQALHKTYRTREALADFDAFIEANPDNLDARSYRLFALQSLEEVTRERLWAEHCAYGERVGRGPATLPGYDLDPSRRLRLGILSPDLRTHSCAYFLEPLLRHLDSAAFELYLYHDHPREDAVSARLKNYAAVWRNFGGQSHAAVEQAIRADRPDILVDLSGHVGSTLRLPLFARRLAPVQVTYLGYPDTTGVPAMDYRFTDAVADRFGDADRFATETLVRFAPTAWAYQPPADTPNVEVPPCADGGPVTFGCFNSPTKFTDSLFAAWGRLLNGVPGSRLLLKAHGVDAGGVGDSILKRLAAQGVPVERVDLAPWATGTREHLAMYARVDVALDTFPYNGTTTTCEALWMGRPVVTLGGDRHAARVGASLLTAIGQPDWIARDVDDYVRIASDLVREPKAVAGVAAGLREKMLHSALLDHAAQAERFGLALRQCWQARCRILPA